MYLSPPSGTGGPVRKLVGFAKVDLDAGESREVSVTIDPADVTHPLSYWSPSADRWLTPSGSAED